MVNVALHVEHRHTRVLGHFVDVTVAKLPVALADGNAVEVTPEDFADLFGSITVRNLGCVRVDKGSMPTELGHARLERTTCARAAEEEQHRQHFVTQIGVRLTESALALQVEGHIQYGFDFFLAEVEVTDEITSVQVGLHNSLH